MSVSAVYHCLGSREPTVMRARSVARGTWRVARGGANDPRSPDAVQDSVAGSCVAHSGVANPSRRRPWGRSLLSTEARDSAGARVNLPTNLWFSRPFIFFLFFGPSAPPVTGSTNRPLFCLFHPRLALRRLGDPTCSQLMAISPGIHDVPKSPETTSHLRTQVKRGRFGCT